jgi:homoaconitate hydratase
VRHGDVLVCGYNFGCGSSREQAATAFLAAGVRAIVAGSFSETFKRNAFNNALLCVECPPLLAALADAHPADARTARTAQHATIDFESATIRLDGGEAHAFAPLGRAVQEVVACGGMEAWVRAQA